MTKLTSISQPCCIPMLPLPKCAEVKRYGWGEHATQIYRFVYNTNIQIYSVIELSTGNLYNFINQCYLKTSVKNNK